MPIVSYTPDKHRVLLEYMCSVYPTRSVDYLEWWISNIDTGGRSCWDKCIVVTSDDDTIIGCTTTNVAKLMVGNDTKDIFLRGNTIVSPEQRGKGISKGLYEFVNGYNNWLSVGITDIAWKIQPKYVNKFSPIQPVRIYVSVNNKLLGQLFRKLIKHDGKKKESFIMPERIDIGKKERFVKVNDIEQLDVPQRGRWSDDKVELVRDKDYFEKRFFNIYCAKRYGAYRFERDGKLAGFVVLRKMYYAGFDMVSVVDYRFMVRKDERFAFAAANKLANKNAIGFIFGMSSRKYSIVGNPILVRARKTLNCAVGNKEIDFSDMLVTSADSDLDFVYYR